MPSGDDDDREFTVKLIRKLEAERDRYEAALVEMARIEEGHTHEDPKSFYGDCAQCHLDRIDGSEIKHE